MILQLSTIFYIIRNNSKSEEYVDWLPNNDLDIRNFNLELNKILFDGNDKSPPILMFCIDCPRKEVEYRHKIKITI